MIQFISDNWETIALVVTGLVSVASAIAKATPNETDNKVVATLQRIIDFVAMSTGRTTLKGDLDV